MCGEVGIRQVDTEDDGQYVYGQLECLKCNAGWHSSYKYQGVLTAQRIVVAQEPWLRCLFCHEDVDDLETEARPNDHVETRVQCRHCGRSYTIFYDFERVTDFMGDEHENESMRQALALADELLEGSRGPEFKTLKKHKVELEPEEREQAMKAGAVWHMSHHKGKPSCAIWKSVVNGKTWYTCNTHRCYQTRPTLKGAITAFKYVETTG